jgi:hypothetical protein
LWQVLAGLGGFWRVGGGRDGVKEIEGAQVDGADGGPETGGGLFGHSSTLLVLEREDTLFIPNTQGNF